MKVLINLQWCKGCGVCVAFCRSGALSLDGDGKPEYAPALCVGCGLCELYCPDLAVECLGEDGPGNREAHERRKGILFTQNEACVRGALCGAAFSRYQSRPQRWQTAVQLPHVGGRFIQMEDEISSLCAVCAASVAGDKAMTATSGPGFSLMQEALGYAIMGEIPCVVTSVQRGGPSTGLPTKVAQGDVNQARWGVHGDHAIIVLTASSVQDVFAMTVEGFNMAETYRTPVICCSTRWWATCASVLICRNPANCPWWSGSVPR
ncbi:MAG: 4Fe-4S dicluster domain-containing protein [Bilophila wadsworthia]